MRIVRNPHLEDIHVREHDGERRIRRTDKRIHADGGIEHDRPAEEIAEPKDEVFQQSLEHEDEVRVDDEDKERSNRNHARTFGTCRRTKQEKLHTKEQSGRECPLDQPSERREQDLNRAHERAVCSNCPSISGLSPTGAI
jgi:hypothetical protein